MPTYEYVCDACGQRFEKFQSITAAPLKKCEHCGKAKARRLIGTGAGLIFKGSGFYITDYRSPSYKEAAKSESGGSTSSSSDSKAGSGTSGGESKSGSASAPATSSPAATPAPAAKPSSSPAKK